MFVPQFQTDVIETLYRYDPVSGFVKVSDTPVNPLYCLTEDSAKELVTLFPFFKSLIYDDFPLGSFMVSVNRKVPMIVFTDAAGRTSDPINAGLLANYFNHGYEYTYAFQSALNDIIARFGS